MQIQGKKFVVTGAASGLGEATAEYLIGAGAKVILIDMNLTLGEALQQRLGQDAQFVQLDVTHEQSVANFFQSLELAKDYIHGLINCAGIAPSAKVLGKSGIHDLSMFQTVLNVNVVGSFNMLRFAAAWMAQNACIEDEECGVIINTASVAAFEGQIGQAAYAASKGAIVAMTLPLARELAKNAIRVMTIAPGIMETPMLKGLPQNVQDALGQMVPFPSRLAKPSEYASLVAHIIENTYLNGEVIRLDGAIRMAAK